MIEQIYVNNFRCFKNFTFDMKELSSVLVLGKNGAGKSTLFRVLEVFKQIGDGESLAKSLVIKEDFNLSDVKQPIRLEIQVSIDGIKFHYKIVFEYPENFKSPKVKSEILLADGTAVITREDAQVSYLSSSNKPLEFLVDWHIIALPIIQTKTEKDLVSVFKSWLSKMILLSPIPNYMVGESLGGVPKPNIYATDIGAWATDLFTQYPIVYNCISNYLKRLMPDFYQISNKKTSESSNKLVISFKKERDTLSLDFDKLSHGEKIFVLSAFIIAANEIGACSFCMWDEPDNYISLVEVEYFIADLRQSFQQYGQWIATTHNPETIRAFSSESTFLLSRSSHLEPARVMVLSDKLDNQDDVVEAIKAGLIEL